MADKVKIGFVGGGTLGPVTPLLAVMEVIRRNEPRAEFLWFGTPNGPEKELVPNDVKFIPIPVAKLPRYPNLEWLTFPFRYLMAGNRAKKVMRKEKPDVIVGAGGFTQVPVIMAADEYFIPSIIHQLDKVVGMSNQSIAPRTRSVTTSFTYEKEPFPKPVKSRQIPTPVRFGEKDLLPKTEGVRAFGLDPDKPITLIIGGGTGALSVNEAVRDALDELLRVTQVIHVTGKGKRVTDSAPGYFVTEFLTDDLLKAYSAADVVVSRAGLGSISECTALGKPMVLIPISDNQQEVNAATMIEAGGAVGLKQDEDFKKNLLEILERLLGSEDDRKELVKGAQSVLPTDDGSALADVVLGLIRRRPAIKSH